MSDHFLPSPASRMPSSSRRSHGHGADPAGAAPRLSRRAGATLAKAFRRASWAARPPAEYWAVPARGLPMLRGRARVGLGDRHLRMSERLGRRGLRGRGADVHTLERMERNATGDGGHPALYRDTAGPSESPRRPPIRRTRSELRVPCSAPPLSERCCWPVRSQRGLLHADRPPLQAHPHARTS